MHARITDRKSSSLQFFLRTRAAHFKWGIESRFGFFFFFLKQNCTGIAIKNWQRKKGHPRTSSETVEYVHKKSIKGNYFDLPNPPPPYCNKTGQLDRESRSCNRVICFSYLRKKGEGRATQPARGRVNV